MWTVRLFRDLITFYSTLGLAWSIRIAFLCLSVHSEIDEAETYVTAGSCSPYIEGL